MVPTEMVGIKYRLMGRRDDSKRPSDFKEKAPKYGTTTLAQWESIHQKIKELPEEEKEVFDFPSTTREMSQEDTARVLKVHKKAVQREVGYRARLNLGKTGAGGSCPRFEIARGDRQPLLFGGLRLVVGI